MKTSDFDYHLPVERIAQTPVEPRHASRLLVLERARNELEHTTFWHIEDYLNPGDMLVINQTRVLPARIFARKPTGGRVELLLLRRVEDGVWEALVGGKKMLPGTRVQVENGFLGWLGYLAAQPLAPIIFMVASLAEVNRSPFDMPEAEQELTAGYHTEYSGMKFALFFMAEYIKMIAVSMIGATLFFGGYYGPFVEQFPILGPVYLFLKVTALLFGMIWIRATLPRIRYDRLMVFGWKGLLPAGLFNVLFTAVVILVLGGM